MTYLERYLQGQQETVWAELVSLGPDVRDEPIYTDALAVARETMRRTRHNIELLVQQLPAIGYQFGYAWAESLASMEEEEAQAGLADDVKQILEESGLPWDAPAGQWSEETSLRAVIHEQPKPIADALPAIGSRIRELEIAVGTLPLSLIAWYEMIGAANFVGIPPARWGISDHIHLLDPLYVDYLFHPQRARAEWYGWIERCVGKRQQKEVVSLDLAGDEYHKYFMSGSGPYSINLPCAGADAIVEGEWHSTTFVNYLRICFRWAGFPGLERAPHPPLRDIEQLTRDLLPI